MLPTAHSFAAAKWPPAVSSRQLLGVYVGKALGLEGINVLVADSFVKMELSIWNHYNIGSPLISNVFNHLTLEIGYLLVWLPLPNILPPISVLQCRVDANQLRGIE